MLPQQWPSPRIFVTGFFSVITPVFNFAFCPVNAMVTLNIHDEGPHISMRQNRTNVSLFIYSTMWKAMVL